MVKQITKDKCTYYRCEECGLTYREKPTANKCEDYCNKHKSCSLKIIKKAVAI